MTDSLEDMLRLVHADRAILKKIEERGKLVMESKVAVISGASTGIGKDSALRLAKEGFHLVLGARSFDKLQDVCEQCRQAGVEATAVKADMTQAADVDHLFQVALDTHGKVDFYFCNQGVLPSPKRFEDQTEEDFYTVSENNFKSVFLGMRSAIRIMKQQQYGNILVTASSSGIRPETGFGLYSASKHAVIGLVKDAAIEAGSSGIRINCLCPGGVWTPMVEKVSAYMQENNFQPPRIMPTLLPNKALADVSEISRMVVFMASEGSSYMTGSIISIDNGITL